MTDDKTIIDAERLSDANYMLANHIASAEPLDDYAREELLACGLVTDADLKMLPNADRLEDPREWYEYVGDRWDVFLESGEPRLVERQTGAGTPPTGSPQSSHRYVLRDHSGAHDDGCDAAGDQG